MLYFPDLFQGPNHLKKNEGPNIFFHNIPSNLFYIELRIFQWKSDIEYVLFNPPPNPSYK